jgi:hypothetical protein
MQADIKAWLRETHYHPGPRNLKCAFCQQSVVDAVFGLSGPVFEHCQDHLQTVNSAQYCAVLEEELKSAILSKDREMMIWSCFAS